MRSTIPMVRRVVPLLFNALTEDGEHAVSGFGVIGTDGTIAVFKCDAVSWRVTHVPTGHSVIPRDYPMPTSLHQAVEIGFSFFWSMIELGVDLHVRNIGSLIEEVGDRGPCQKDDAARRAWWKGHYLENRRVWPGDPES